MRRVKTPSWQQPATTMISTSAVSTVSMIDGNNERIRSLLAPASTSREQVGRVDNVRCGHRDDSDCQRTLGLPCGRAAGLLAGGQLISLSADS